MHEVALRVRGRLLIAGGGGRTSSEGVFCPAKGRSVSTSVCKECVHAHSVSSASVVCSPPGPMLAAGMGAPAGSAALTRWTVVRADVPGMALVSLSGSTPWPLPVVDDSDRFLGFVSSAQLERPKWPWHRIAVTLAREFVAGASLLVPEVEPLGRALRMMARRGARSLALVDPSGVLRGVLTDVDALHAAAHPDARDVLTSAR